MPKDISIKQLRANLADVADRVERGESFRVIRRSKPAFIIMSVDGEIPEDDWETVVDFTEGGTSDGMSMQDAMKLVRNIRSSHEKH